MFRGNSFKLFLITCCVILSSAASFFMPSLTAGQDLPFSEVEEKLAGLTGEEAETLEILFSLVQEIENMEKEQEELAAEMIVMEREIYHLESRIKIEEKLYNHKRSGLRQVLRSYQRMGAATYLEIILDADSLGIFLRRLNTLKDLARNTGELLNSIGESRDRLTAERERHGEKLLQLAARQEQLEEFLAATLQLQEELEEHLVSLEEERDYYQEQLENMQQAWADLKPFISETIREFSLFIKEGEMPSDAMETTVTLLGIRAIFNENKFNEIIAGCPGLPVMVFSFFPGKVELSIPEKHLLLKGSFIIVEESAIEYKAAEGTFYGMPLGERALKELFRESPFRLDFEPLIGNNILFSIETREEKMELHLIPSFFRN